MLYLCFLVDCAEIMYNGGSNSGLYTIGIQMTAMSALTAYCDQQTDDGGWLVSVK